MKLFLEVIKVRRIKLYKIGTQFVTEFDFET